MASTARTPAEWEKLQPQKMTRAIWTLFIICCVTATFDSAEGIFFAFTIPIWMKLWNVDASTMGFIATASTWIAILGTLGFPLLADIYGRRPMFTAGVLGYSLITFLTGFSQNVFQLGIFRSLVRIPLNGTSGVAYMVVAESIPTRLRSIMLSGLNSMYPVAYMLAALLAGPIVTYLGWPWLFFSGAVPILLLIYIVPNMRETAGFARVKAYRESTGKTPRPDLLTPWKRYPRRMLIGFVVVLLYGFTWSGYSTWLPSWMVKDIGLPFQTAAFYQAFWMAIGIPAYWVCSGLARRFGNKRVVPIFTMLGGILLLTQMAPWAPSGILWWGILVNFVVVGSYGSGSSAFLQELFPSEIRGAATGSIQLVNGFLGSWAPLLMGIIIDKSLVRAFLPWAGGISQSFIVPGIAFLLIGPIFYFFAPETAGVPIADLVSEDPNAAKNPSAEEATKATTA